MTLNRLQLQSKISITVYGMQQHWANKLMGQGHRRKKSCQCSDNPVSCLQVICLQWKDYLVYVTLDRVGRAAKTAIYCLRSILIRGRVDATGVCRFIDDIDPGASLPLPQWLDMGSLHVQRLLIEPFVSYVNSALARRRL